jgi:hypothetical protein
MAASRSELLPFFSTGFTTVLIKNSLPKPAWMASFYAVAKLGFRSKRLENLQRDEQWLARASDSLVQHWKKKNAKNAAAAIATTAAQGSDSTEPPFAEGQ